MSEKKTLTVKLVRSPIGTKTDHREPGRLSIEGVQEHWRIPQRPGARSSSRQEQRI